MRNEPRLARETRSPVTTGLLHMRRRGLEPPPTKCGPGPQPCNSAVRYVRCVHIVQIVHECGGNGRTGRSGCCHGRGQLATARVSQAGGSDSACRRPASERSVASTATTRNRGSRTRPSSRSALDRRVLIPAGASLLSAVESALDTLDEVDVVRGVVAIRDRSLRILVGRHRRPGRARAIPIPDTAGWPLWSRLWRWMRSPCTGPCGRAACA